MEGEGIYVKCDAFSGNGSTAPEVVHDIVLLLRVRSVRRGRRILARKDGVSLRPKEANQLCYYGERRRGKIGCGNSP